MMLSGKEIMNLKHKNIFCFIGLLLITISSAYAVPKTLYFWQPGKNQFWPNTVFAGFGNSFQQTTVTNNPDLYCNSLGDGWYLPSLGDYSAYYSDKYVVNASGQNVLPGAAINYVNGGTTSESNKIPKPASWNTPQTGSLLNEWGLEIDLHKKPIAFWTREITLQSPPQRFLITFPSTSDAEPTITRGSDVNYVACMKNIPA